MCTVGTFLKKTVPLQRRPWIAIVRCLKIVLAKVEHYFTCVWTRIRRLVGIRRETFPGHIVSAWWHWVTKFLPDLNTCHFFLWRYLKVQVNQHRLKTLKDLTVVITQKITTIPPGTIRIDSYQCIENEGHKIIKNNYNKTALSLALSVQFKIKKYVFTFDLFWFLLI